MSQSSHASNVVVSGLADLIAKEQLLRERKRELRQLQDRREWEAKTKARNPQYVIGSLRPATSQDEDILSHCHGWVCEIECRACGKRRVINKQDAFQAHYCKGCLSDARKEKSKVKRLEKRVEGRSVEDLEAAIATLDAQIAEMN